MKGGLFGLLGVCRRTGREKDREEYKRMKGTKKRK